LEKDWQQQQQQKIIDESFLKKNICAWITLKSNG
jgi:hypothetical protein